mmetsp:Transcript_92002/g.176260  ORF Transcript_92002/g.176260 Transcript_92002/m.176260 type:complete len:567 (+) Transcript_92002:90-1790(+)
MTAEEMAGAAHGSFLKFPKDFTFGVATASYQIEGAVAEGGRKPSIWDDYVREPGRITDGKHADIACDHYHRFRDDIKLMGYLGIKAYRLSISWSRVIPDGEGAVNEEGIKFYMDVIDCCLEHGIEPWVTIYHWDLPSALEADFKGWIGPKERIVNAFGEYARLLFSRFGSKVKYWMTLNEPRCTTMFGYANGEHAPGRDQANGTEPYICCHNLLLAHGRAAEIYHKEFQPTQGGKIGVVISSAWYHPFDPASESDKAAAQRALDFVVGQFSDPLFFGDYPAIMREVCGDRLPKFTPEESKMITGSVDFYGINSYTTRFCTFPPPGEKCDLGLSMWGKPQKGGAFDDFGVNLKPWSGLEKTDMGWPVVPWGLRELLLYLTKRYQPKDGVYITENGCAWEPAISKELDARPGALDPQVYVPSDANKEDFEHETFHDPERVKFFKQHLAAVHEANARGGDVRGYLAWSFMDNFEWGFGYWPRFGIVRVDYMTQKRTIKASGRFFAQTVKEGGFVALKEDAEVHHAAKRQKFDDLDKSGDPFKRQISDASTAYGKSDDEFDRQVSDVSTA